MSIMDFFDKGLFFCFYGFGFSLISVFAFWLAFAYKKHIFCMVNEINQSSIQKKTFSLTNKELLFVLNITKRIPCFLALISVFTMMILLPFYIKLMMCINSDIICCIFAGIMVTSSACASLFVCEQLRELN